MRRLDGQPKVWSRMGLHRRYSYGVTWRNRRKPWLVKFKRNKKSIYVGSYFHYDEAVLAAERFLRNELSNHPPSL
jgi:hypothetical protein